MNFQSQNYYNRLQGGYRAIKVVFRISRELILRDIRSSIP